MKPNPNRSSVTNPDNPQPTAAAPANPPLKLGEGQFRLAFDNAPIGMAIVGLDYRMKRVNKALCVALGYSESELLEREFMDITHPDDLGKDKELAAQLFRGEIPTYRLEKRFINRDGGLVWLDLTAVMIGANAAEPLYGLAMVENVTDRKRTHEALRTSEERYRSFVVNSSEGIWRFEIEQPIDISLPTDDQIALFFKHAYLAECNDAMARMYGHLRADDVVGARFGDIALQSSPANPGSLRKFISSGYRLLDVKTEELDTTGSLKSFSNSVIGIVVNGMLLRVWGVQRDETEQHRAEEELKRSHQQLRALAAYLQSIREKERADIAREMHDVFGQSLTSLRIDIAWMTTKLKNAGSVTPAIDERLQDIDKLLNETIASVKRLSTELRPGVLDQFGLGAAIEWQCEEFSRRTGIKCDCRIPRKELALTPERSTALFRILQEALTNVARHSHATHAEVELAFQRPNAVLSISDNGTGITTEQMLAPDSLGLLGMRERAELLNGSFTVDGKPGAGTTVKASLALSASPSPTTDYDDD